MAATNAGLLTPVLGDPVPWSPRRLYAAGEAGGWWNPSDLTTEKVAWALANPGFTPAQFLAVFPNHALFQDDAGTIPTALLGQPVGCALDQSGNGNTLIQPSAGSRPILDARINELVGTTTLATQSVTTYAADYLLSFSGTGTVTMSGSSTAGPLVGTGVGQRVELAFTAGPGTLTLTVTGTVTDADLRLAQWDGYAYQRVTTATDYADVGAPRSFLFDGTNGGLYSAAAVTLTATDEMTVVAGLAKASDAAAGVLVELTANASSTNGAFALLAPSVASGLDAAYISRGTTAQQAAWALQPPLPTVSTGLSDISADSVILRRNAVQVAASAGDQGTGTYSSAVLYVGRRNNASEPFAGRLYQLVVRGALTEGTLLLTTEAYVGGKMQLVLPAAEEPLSYLLLENGDFVLLEDGGRIALEYQA
jgi:hypothetical protein